MRTSFLPLALLASVAVSLATTLGPWFLSWQGGRSASLLETALGDGRRLFGNHFYAKADAYFHNGYYPTIFDNRDGYEKAHLAEGVHGEGEGEEGEHHEEGGFLGQPRDWVEAFGRHFFPARHTHLGDSGCGHSCCQRAKADSGEEHGHDHDHDHAHHEHGPDCKHDDHDHAPAQAARRADEREMLPWLKLSAELDPHRVETYVVTSYWLRSALKKVDEAEQFLRYGLQQNPGDFEILFELGRIYAEERKDFARARNVWEVALQKWDERESGRSEPNIFLRAQILGQLAKLEEGQGNFRRAIEHLTKLEVISPSKDSIRKWIGELRAKL